MSTKIKDTQKMIEEVLDAYPEKSKKERAKHLAANDPTGQCSSCRVKSNVKSRPGVMTVRGARTRAPRAWSGAGEGPDHGQPRSGGLRQYSWWSRRNYYNGQTGIDALGTMHITTDFQEKTSVRRGQGA
jgi:nitrogenase molybdenum-iron protein alpha chain